MHSLLAATLILAQSIAAPDPLAVPAGTERVALSADGRQIAFEGTDGLIVGTIAEGVPPSTPPIEIDGRVRSLAWTGYDEPTLWVLRHRPAKRRVGDTDLLQVDLERRRVRRVLRLPDDATGLAWWPLERSLIVAAGPTLRTIRLDGLTSGPMYRMPRDVRLVACLGGSRMLLSEDERLILVDLRDPPGPESMPIRDALPLAVPLRAIVTDPDGDAAVAVDETDTQWRISVEPSRADSNGRRGVPASGLRPSREPQPPVVADVLRPAPTERVELPALAQIGGTIVGPATADVAAVQILGPDNLLREAARVRPSGNGRWSVSGLLPGRYRVQLAGVGGAVLLSEPRFILVRIEPEVVAPIVLAPIRALRTQ